MSTFGKRKNKLQEIYFYTFTINNHNIIKFNGKMD